MKEFNCEFSYFNNIPNAYSLVLNKCDDVFEKINFYGLYYGLFNGSMILFILFIIVLIALIIVLLSVISERYLSESMSKMTDKIKLNESFAAITLLAFSNSAPDLITTLISSSPGDENTNELIGQLIGSTLFSLLIGLAFIIYKSQTKIISIEKIIFIKEILFYFSLIGLIFMCSFLGYINIKVIVCFIILYVIYLVSSLVINKYNVENQMEAVNWECFENQDFGDSIHSKKRRKELFNILLSPFELLWRITIPYEENIFLKNMLTSFITYFFSPLFTFYIFGLSINVKILIACWIIAIIGVFIQFSNTYYFFYREFWVISSSIAWIFICAALISDVLKLISLNLHVSKLFLVSVFLSIGNTIGDIFSNGSLSKIGKSKMAVYGVISGQSFILLLAFTLNNTRSIMASSKKFIKFQLFDSNKISYSSIYVLISILFLLSNFFLIFLYLLSNKFSLKPNLVKFLLISYGAFLSLSTFFEYKFDLNK